MKLLKIELSPLRILDFREGFIAPRLRSGQNKFEQFSKYSISQEFSFLASMYFQ